MSPHSSLAEDVLEDPRSSAPTFIQDHTHEAAPITSHQVSRTRAAPPQSGIGRLDAGQLELVLVEGTLRSEQKTNDASMTPDEIVRSLDTSFKRSIDDAASLDVYVQMQYALVPDDLRVSIESEPNTFVQGRMRHAVAGLIEETLLEFDAEGINANPTSINPELARLKALSVPFEDSGCQPKQSEDDLRELFYLHLLDVQFLPSESSPVCTGLKPYLTYCLPSEVGNPREFKHVFHTYDAKWSKLQACQHAGGYQFMTRAVRSTERAPIIVVKLYQRGEHGKKDRLIGMTSLLTHELVDIQQPFKRVWRSLEPPLIYELLPNTESPSPVARFRTVWRATKFLEDHGIDHAAVLRSVSKSIRLQGCSVNLDFNWSIRVRQGSSFRGELYFLSRFIPATATPLSGANFFVEGSLGTATVVKDIEFVSHRAPTDAFGAPLPHLPYNPNLPIVRQMGPDNSLVNQWEFERLDYEDIRRKEQFSELMSQESLWRWQTFLTERHQGGDRLPNGEEQWAEIEKASQAMGKATSTNDFSWVNTINDLCGPELPRFLVEVWCGSQFCGESLLPKLIDIRRVHQSRTLFRLFPSDPKNSLSRPDRKKALATQSIRGWIHMQATWRCLNSKSGRLSLAVRELRDISTASHSETQMQPVSPQVKVYKYDTVTREWSDAMSFSPFEYALYFLNQGQAQRSMGTQWRWDEDLMGGPEPDWKNYFSWDNPQKLSEEERETSVPLSVEYQIKPKLKFEELVPEQNNNDVRIWRLCKGGVPSLLRPYVWTQLSGAYKLKRTVNAQFKKVIPEASRKGANNAYEFLVKQASNQDMQVFKLIDEDLRDMKASLGLDPSFSSDLTEVVRVLMSFSSVSEFNSSAIRGASALTEDGLTLTTPQGSDARVPSDRREKSFTCERESAGVGVPLAYSKSLVRMTYSLLLEFGGLRIPKEDVFYLVYSLTGAGSKRLGIRKAPFLQYFSLFPFATEKSAEGFQRQTFADDIPYAVRDAMFLRAALEILHPKKAEVLRISGVHVEEILFGCLNGLFAGFLPTQSLFRLWDLLMNVIFPASQLIETPLSYTDLQTRAQQELLKEHSTALTNPCCVPPVGDIVGPSDPPSPVKLFDESHGRRILISFCYSLLTSVLNDLPVEPTPKEIKLALKCRLLSLRDPSEVISMASKGDFVLFTSSLHLQYITQLSQYYIKIKSEQMEAYKEQNKVLQEIVQPWQELYGHSTPTQIAMTMTSKPYDASEAFRPKSVGVGLTTEDLRDSLYPSLKYHALYAPPSVRELPHNSLGRVVFKIDELDLYGTKLNCSPEVTVRFAKQSETRISKFFGDGENYVWKDANVFHFIVKTPPPYKVKIEIRDCTEQSDLSIKSSFSIKKLISQGDSYKLLTPKEIRGAEKATVNLSWYMYTNSVQMFFPGTASPKSTTTMTLQSTIPPTQTSLSTSMARTPMMYEPEKLPLSSGLWGDLAPLNTMRVESPSDQLIKHMRIELDPFAPKLHNDETFSQTLKPGATILPAHHGVNKYMLDELLFHSMPSLLPLTDAIACQFGMVKDHSDPQQIASASVSLRELVSALIIASRGTVLDKASLLFDLFGHHESDRGTSGSHHLYYDDVSMHLSPETFKEASTLHSYLPSGALSSIQRDGRTIVNCISLAEAIACTQTILRRSCIHVDNLEAFQIGSSIFEPCGQVPRVLAATLSTIQSIARVDDKHDPNNPLRTAVIRTVEGEDATPNTEFHEVTRDVTTAVLQTLQDAAANSGLFGFNFTTLRTIEHFGIKDPFPGSPKTLRIAVSRTGSFDSVEVISIEVDAGGNFWTGSGGNMKKKCSARSEAEVATHLRKLGTFGPHKVDVIANDRLADASFVFDMHTTLLDKELFITRLLHSDILSEALRRPTSVDRASVERPVLSVKCTIPITLDRETLYQLHPLSFKTGAKKAKKKSTKDPMSSNPTSPGALSDTTTPGSPPALDVEAPSSPDVAMQEVAVHATAASDFVGCKLKVNVIKAIELYNTEWATNMDPYCKITLGSKSLKTKVLNEAGRNPEWNEMLEFDYNGEEMLKVEVWEKDPMKDDYVGATEVSLRDLIFETTREGEYNLLRKDDAAAGKLTLAVELKQLGSGRHPSLELPNDAVRTSSERKKHGSNTKRDSKRRSTERPKEHDDINSSLTNAEQPSRLKVVIRSARDLYNTEMLGKMDPYCKCTFGTQQGRTQTLKNAGTTPNWHASFMFILDQNSSDTPVKFEVYDEDTMTADDFIGTAQFDLRSLSPHDQQYSGEIELSRPDGKSGGFLSVRIGVDSPPQGPLPEVLRMTLSNAKFNDGIGTGMFDSSDAYTVVILEGENGGVQEMTTKTVRTQDSESVVWDEVLDFKYNGEHMVKFRVMDHKKNVLGQTKFDIWAILKQGKDSAAGNLALQLKNLSNGRLNIGVEFLRLPDGIVWPANVKTTVKEFDCVEDLDTFGKMDPYIKIHMGDQHDKTPTLDGAGKQGCFGSVFNFINPTTPNVELEFWDDDPMKDDFGGSGHLSIVDMLMEGKQEKAFRVKLWRAEKLFGDVIVQIKATRPPTPAPGFCKITVHKAQCNKDLDIIGNMDPYVVVTMGKKTLRTFTASGQGMKPKWNQSFVGVYELEPMIRFDVFDEDPMSSELIGGGEVDLWELLNRKEWLLENYVINLTTKSGEKTGKLTLTLDFFDKSIKPDDILGLRVAIRSGRDLGLGGGDLFSKMDPFIKVKLLNNVQQTTVATDGGGDPDFGDEELFIDWPEKGDCEHVTLEAWDKDKVTNDDLLSTQSLHLWDMFRDPKQTWVGDVPMTTSKGKAGGKVTVAMQLVCKASIQIAIGCEGGSESDGWIFSEVESIDYHDSVKLLKEKIARACWKASRQQTENPEVARIMAQLRLNDQYEVVWVNQYGVAMVLEDDRKLSDYEEEGLLPKKYSRGPARMTIQKKPGLNDSQRSDINDSATGQQLRLGEIPDTRATKYPLAVTTFPDPTTVPTVESVNKPSTADSRGLVDRASEKLRHTEIEIHPSQFISSQNLSWVKIQTVDPQHGLSHLNLLKSRARKDEWVPCVRCRTIESDSSEVVLLNFQETRVGFEDPYRSRPISVPNWAVVTNFAFGDTPPNEYEVPTASLSTRRRMLPAAPWRPPAFLYPNSPGRDSHRRSSRRRSSRRRRDDDETSLVSSMSVTSFSSSISSFTSTESDFEANDIKEEEAGKRPSTSRKLKTSKKRKDHSTSKTKEGLIKTLVSKLSSRSSKSLIL